MNADFKLRLFSDNDYEGIVTLRNTLYPNHPKTVDMVRHYDKTHKGKLKHKRFVLEEDGAIVVCAGYEQFIESYHPQKFVIYIHVLESLNNKGYGSNSYNFLIDNILQFNPIKITSMVNEIHARGVRFLEDRGFIMSMKEQESALDLTAYDPKKYNNEIDNILNQAFRIITLTEFRKEEKEADYKCWELEREVAPDMPWTDPITMPKYDHYKKNVLANPRFNPDSWFIIKDNDFVAGLNNLWESPNKTVVNTGFTGVLRKYRKMGIATALKHTNLAWAKKHGYKTIRTNNADSNKSMLNINIRAGFKFMPAWLVFDKILKEEK